VNGIDPVIGRTLRGFKRIAELLYWRAYGLILFQPPTPPSPRTLLFVCKGNICRSPFAEAMARRRIPVGLPIICRSAGIEVGLPEGCPREAIAAAEMFGVDLSAHRSRRIDQGLVAGADMVFAMEVWQLSRLRKIFPQYKERMFLLPLFDGSPPGQVDASRLLNISDPYGRTLKEFIECFERIDASLKGIFSRVGDACIRHPVEEDHTVVRPGRRADRSLGNTAGPGNEGAMRK
jgi:protein-tyrosine phosphatase